LKILAFSDLHRDVDAARKIVEASAHADILIGAGDFANFGEGAAEIIQILQTTDTPTIVVPGNHDNLDELRELCAGWAEGHFLHGHTMEFQDVTFFGLGGEVPRRNPAIWNVSVSEEEAASVFTNCPKNAVLITHMPPLGCADLQRDGTHDGSTAIAAVIEDAQPVFNFCGHIHSSWGLSGKIGATTVHNLGPGVNWFDL